MRVLVIGANGNVGKNIVKNIKNTKELEPVAMIRKEEQIEYFNDIGVETVLADLESNFEKAFNKIDAVIFAAGSGPNTGPDKTIIIDQEGAIEAADLAMKNGVERFVLLSSMGADQPKEASKGKFYLYAKHRADEYLKSTNLNYTIVRPGALTDDPGEGKVNLQESGTEFGEVPREDVAAVIVHLLTKKEANGKVYEVVSGNTEVANVL
ncbi:NAD dependent epimerase/dehydratase [Oceanobacillus picturae]|uniref:NAD dependent epimerase/dehydratase n=1 Tax=Oceanobacillus picturae TaxID=171693 RepID=A0A0U9H520_9BACI|nr:SDR family oxidoreductase [Oceanobacillus picturae]GAQ17783.1 NAD dependent epimerase/dehydratase [Oceanobacillus picturae]